MAWLAPSIERLLTGLGHTNSGNTAGNTAFSLNYLYCQLLFSTVTKGHFLFTFIINYSISLRHVTHASANNTFPGV